MTISFRVEGLPPSYNFCFQIIWAFKECHLSPEAHHFKNRVKMLIPPTEWNETCKFKLTIDYHSNWFCKNGNYKKIDMQNMHKLLIDAIFESIGKDDSMLWELNEKKIQDKEEYTFVTIEEL